MKFALKFHPFSCTHSIQCVHTHTHTSIRMNGNDAIGCCVRAFVLSVWIAKSYLLYLRLRQCSRFRITHFDVAFDLFTTFLISQQYHHPRPDPPPQHASYMYRVRCDADCFVSSNLLQFNFNDKIKRERGIYAETMSVWLKCRSNAFEDAFSHSIHSTIMWWSDCHRVHRTISMLDSWWFVVRWIALQWFQRRGHCGDESFHFVNDACSCSIASFLLRYSGQLPQACHARSLSLSHSVQKNIVFSLNAALMRLVKSNCLLHIFVLDKFYSVVLIIYIRNKLRFYRMRKNIWHFVVGVVVCICFTHYHFISVASVLISKILVCASSVHAKIAWWDFNRELFSPTLSSLCAITFFLATTRNCLNLIIISRC